MIKKVIRNQMLELRKQLDSKLKEKYDQSLVEKIRQDEHYQKAKTVAIYMPMKYECNLLDLTKDDKFFLIPRIEGENLSFVTYHKDMVLSKSLFGTSEPNNDCLTYEDKIDYMVLPALAISKNRHRIGYGKGYYDRYVKEFKPVRIVGAIYPFQEVETFEHETHDQMLDGYFVGE